MQESDILYQSGPFWVCAETFGRRKSPGFAVYKVSDSGTHSRRVASIGFAGEVGLARAIAEANRRLDAGRQYRPGDIVPVV